jgi:type I restriction-modification system DNA methylase subunit
MNEGHKGKTEDIFGYNGGLFKTDSLLEELVIDDDVLKENILKLVVYDFDTEVDVTILGHIFENSLSEIETVGTVLAVAQNADIPVVTVSKRKKDGVFYTPRYITTYIVENTLGKLCSNKKTELILDESEYFFDKKRAKSETKRLSDKLTVYRDWLLSLTICDPACGSGAFLNAALDFLMNEHRLVDEMTAKLFGNAIVFPNIENAILENNLYGVDINEESVEIAQLSLWLRTAKPQRKLNSLNNNIKYGNSLISDPEVAGEKAFDWHKKFPQVFEKGGFDVVIGNPPYLNMTKANTPDLNYYIDKYESVRTANSKNLYTLFNEKSMSLVRDNGLISFIIPEGFLKTRSYSDCVRKMNNNGTIIKSVYFEDWVFEDATTGSMIFEFVKSNDDKYKLEEYLCNRAKEIFKIETNINPIIEKYNRLDFPVLSDLSNIFKGMAVKNRGNFIFENKGNNPDMFLLGNCIGKYNFKNQYYTDYSKLTIVGGTKNKSKHDISPRILIRRTGNFLCCVLLNEPALTESTLYSCSTVEETLDIKYLLTILNSALLTYIVRQNMITNAQAFPQILMTDIQSLKIPCISKYEQQPFINLADKMISLNTNLQINRQRFRKRLSDNFTGIKITSVLEHFDELAFKQFLAELGKQKITLSLKQQDEWEECFNECQSVCSSFVSQINATDKEIDRKVYELYGLTEEEVEIIKNK